MISLSAICAPSAFLPGRPRPTLPAKNTTLSAFLPRRPRPTLPAKNTTAPLRHTPVPFTIPRPVFMPRARLGKNIDDVEEEPEDKDPEGNVDEEKHEQMYPHKSAMEILRADKDEGVDRVEHLVKIFMEAFLKAFLNAPCSTDPVADMERKFPHMREEDKRMYLHFMETVKKKHLEGDDDPTEEEDGEVNRFRL